MFLSVVFNSAISCQRNVPSVVGGRVGGWRDGRGWMDGWMEGRNMEHDTDREKGNLCQCYRSHVDWPGIKPGLCRDRLETNCLSHDTAPEGYCLNSHEHTVS
jgi:hypothetical protein